MENILKPSQKQIITGKYTAREDDKESPILSTDFYLEYFRILESISDSRNNWFYRPRSAPGLSLDVE